MTKSKLLPSSLLAATLYFGLTGMGHAALSKPLESMPVDPSEILSVVATPLQGNTLYRLTLYKGEEETNPVITVTHSLDGEIVDIVIKDVDDDGQDELVVAMLESRVNVDQLHFDVFEFEGKSLSLIEKYTNIATLLSIIRPK